MRNIFLLNLSSLSIYILVITTSLTKSTFASKSYLRLANNERNLQKKSKCTQSCNSDEIVRVLIKTSDKTGKKNALSCSMSESSTDPQDDMKIKTPDGGFILGIAICLDDRLAIENLDGIINVEDDQVYIALNSDCRKDCRPDEIERVLIQTSNELGKDNALTCSMASKYTRGNVEIKLGSGYILGIGVCPLDRTVLENAEGIKYVEDDHDVYIQPIN